MSQEFVLKDSGQREEFSTGARRDIQQGKSRFDLIPVGPLRRLADLYERGARKYSENNWQKGMPFRRVYASLLRHIYDWAAGDRTEDALAAVAFNAFALMYYEDTIMSGQLPESLDDMGVLVAKFTNTGGVPSEPLTGSYFVINVPNV